MQTRLAIKIAIIFAVGIFILIPVSMVKSKVYERQIYLEQAKTAVASSWTGPQMVVTPVIVITYSQSPVRAESGFYTGKDIQVADRTVVLTPENLKLESVVQNKTLHKGIYDVPVYASHLRMAASFSAQRLREKLASLQHAPGVEKVSAPYLALHISDVRGIDSEPLLTINDEQLKLEPGSRLSNMPSGLHAKLGKVPVSDQELKLSMSLALRGMESLTFVPLGDYAELSMTSDWPHPEFVGASLPRDRLINDQGFEAKWFATKYTNNNQDLFATCNPGEQCIQLHASASGVRFIEPVDIYLQSERSIKYAMLFIGLSFIIFFIFETVKQSPIHPIQYTLVGLAIAIFYLLLISLAEHIAFAAAYGIAVACCCGLLMFYVRYMFSSLVSSLTFSAMIAGLYGLLYVIIQAEDYALLMGSILVFMVLAVVMFITRRMDWYKLGVAEPDPETG